MSATDPPAVNTSPLVVPADFSRGSRLLLSWKLWLVLLVTGLCLIAVALCMPVYRRMQAFDYLDSHEIDYELTDDNEWMTERFGRWGRGFRSVRSIMPRRINDEAAIAHIAEFQETKGFHCYGGIPLSEPSIEALASLIHVEELTLGNVNFTDELLARWFANRPPLRKVTLIRSAISHRGLRELSRIDTLQHLWFFGTALTDSEFLDLEPPQRLRALMIDEAAIGPLAGAWIGGMPELRSLVLNQAMPTPDFWSSLVARSRLESIHCESETFTAMSLQSLSRLASVTELTLTGSTLDDAGLEHISRMPALSRLCLARSVGFTDAGVRHLSDLATLEFLDLGSAKD